MGAVVLDTSVVIGFLRDDDAHHQIAVSEVRAVGIRDDIFVLPATVLGESLVAAQQAGAAVAESMRRDLVDFFGPVRPVDEEIAFVMSKLRARFASLRVPDALVVATGIVDDAVVLTCDKRLASVDHRVQVVGG
jgi:predicted nucleic acid-binding protein